MDPDFNTTNATPERTVLRGRGVKTKRAKMAWSSGVFMVIGILLLLSSGMIAITVGGVVARLGVLIGLGTFAMALLLKTYDLASRIYYEGRENDK
jgi:uncharacterized membrane protein (DUF485 family)